MSLPPRNPQTVLLPIHRFHAGEALEVTDTLAVEEPLEIRIEYGPIGNREARSLSITMRTPGFDFELAVGFLVSEGIVHSASELWDVKFCGPALFLDGATNVVKVSLSPSVTVDLKKLERHFYTTSSCGVCGKTSLEALNSESEFSTNDQQDPAWLTQELILGLSAKLRAAQPVFESTGGLHATALFAADGKLLCLREDVGRHNAFDKVVGQFTMKNELPLQKHIAMVSGRASFELVQKAHMAGIRVLVAVGAPSSLAVQLAKESGMTLIGFLRNEKFNVYCGEQRLMQTRQPEAQL